MSTIFETITKNPEYLSAKKALIQTLKNNLSKIDAPRDSDPAKASTYEQLVQQVGDLRGRELFYKWICSGAGNGPFIELADGSVKYDLITGIGVNFFGHGNLELFESEIDSLWCDVMQGNLGPNLDYPKLMEKLLESTGAKSNLKHVWLTTCGATANEIALKIIRQKKSPATKIFAFKDCFAGRTTALQEVTDNPKYREGQPTYNEVTYLEFFNPKSSDSAAEQAQKVIRFLEDKIKSEPGRYCTLIFEIVQGEGGFTAAPKEFLLPIIQAAKKHGLAIWADEIQTFGRTGEVFCYQRLELDEYIDVVTVAKLLQNGAALYTKEYNPKPGLISGTFAGSSSGISAGIKVMEILKNRLCGKNGRIRQLEKITIDRFEQIKKGPQGKHLVDYTAFGGMVAFTLFDGSLEKTKKYLNLLWNNGAAGFFCGHGPYRVRLLPPFGVLTDQQWLDVMSRLESTIGATAKELNL